MLSSLLLLGTDYFLKSEDKLKKVQEKTENISTSLIAEQVIIRDIWGAKPSYNLNCQKDDSNKLFFAFDPSCRANCEREVKLDSLKKTMNFIITNSQTNKAGNITPYANEKAFDITSSSTNFVSLDKEGILSSQIPTLWRNRNLLIIYADNYLENGADDCGNRPYLESFIGFVPDTAGGSKKLIKISLDDVVKLNPLFPDEGAFLLNFKQSFSASSNILIAPIKVVRYKLEENPNSVGYYDLYRSEFEYLEESQEFNKWIKIISKIKSVKFKRESISIPNITMKIAF